MITGFLGLKLSCLIAVMLSAGILAWNRKSKILECKEKDYGIGETWFPIKVICVMVKIMLYVLMFGSIIFYIYLKMQS